MEKMMADTNSATSAPEHLEAIRYTKPAVDGKRGIVRLARSDTMVAMIQVLKPGAGEIELHSHTALDGLWFVLKGKARFYGAGTEYIEVGPHEAVFVPHDAPYWFENSGDDDLELLQVEAIDRTKPNKYNRLSDAVKVSRLEMFDMDGTLVKDEIVDRTRIGEAKLDDFYPKKTPA
jgi:mannose-6-phosphate isomerase-like protein (cupin superfamily)